MRHVNLLLSACLLTLPLAANAIVVRTDFSGGPEGSLINPVEGYYQYETDDGGPGLGYFEFSGGATKFYAKTWDGVEVTSNSFSLAFANKALGNTIQCGPVSTGWDAIAFNGPEGFFFGLIDCSGQMFSSDVDTRAETNIPITRGGSIQVSTVSVGWTFSNFIVNSLTPAPVSLPEPATIALFGLGLAGMRIARRRKR